MKNKIRNSIEEVIEYQDNLATSVKLMNIKEYPVHNHRDIQIIYVLDGELELKLSYTQYILRPGSVHYIHSEDIHSLRTLTESNLVLVISFDVNYFSKLFPSIITTVILTNISKNDNFATKVEKQVKDQIIKIVAEHCERVHGFAERANDAAVSLINILIKNFRGFVIESTRKVYSPKTSQDYLQVDRISRIISYIYQNYPYKIRLSDVAERERLDIYYLSHLFRKFVGMNFRNFLSLVRCEMSESRLLSSNDSITTISNDMGFSDPKYYVSHFRSLFGSHPKMYRQQTICNTIESAMIEGKIYRRDEVIPTLRRYYDFSNHNVDQNGIVLVELNFDELESKIKDNAIEFADDFKMKEKNTLLRFDILASESISAPLESDGIVPDLAVMYQGVSSQEPCIKILEELSGPKKIIEANLFMETVRKGYRIFDEKNKLNGIFSYNGMRKPLYYFLKLMKKMPNNIMKKGKGHIVLGELGRVSIILFNDFPNTERTMHLIITNIDRNIKITKHRLIASKTCIEYWEQLNFSEAITDQDCRYIDSMTVPDVSFNVLSPGFQRLIIETLPPQEIQFMEIEAI